MHLGVFWVTPLNAGLLNSLSVKHPLLLMVFVVLSPINSNKTYSIGLLAMLLGSVWAELEFNWGGW